MSEQKGVSHGDYEIVLQISRESGRSHLIRYNVGVFHGEEHHLREIVKAYQNLLQRSKEEK